MINKFKNLFKPNNAKVSELDKSKNRNIDSVLKESIEDRVDTNVVDDLDEGEGADDIMVMNYDMTKEFDEKSKGQKPIIEMPKHTVSGLTNKKSTIPMSQYKVDELVMTTVKQFAPMIVKKGIRLEMDGLDISIKTNKEVMLFILQEIISNSINNMAIGEIKIYMLEKELLVIEDNGNGIPKDELSKVFEEGFVGSKSPNKDSSEGVGLFKTAIALEKMGYSYEIQSAEGVGTGMAIKVG